MKRSIIRKIKLVVYFILSLISGINCAISILMILSYSILALLNLYHHGPFMESIKYAWACFMFILFAIVCLLSLVAFYSEYKSTKKEKK